MGNGYRCAIQYNAMHEKSTSYNTINNADVSTNNK